MNPALPVIGSTYCPRDNKMKPASELVTLSLNDLQWETGNFFIRMDDSFTPQFGTPESDNYDTSLETLKILVKGLRLITPGSLGIDETRLTVWDPYYNRGLAGEYWDELGFVVHHRPVDFFEDSNIPLRCYNPDLSEELFMGAEILITK
jgi:hypothetical protein